jgi:predicted dienelactone hydrolase
LHLVDESRTERYGDVPGDARELMVQIFYPAEPAPDAKPAPWISDPGAIGSGLTAAHNLPSFALDHLEYTDSHTYPDAPLAGIQDRYPIVVYSHGWGGFRTVSANQAETLASEGFVVVTIDHTYASAMTVFPGGRQVPLDPNALPDEDEVAKEAFDRAAAELMDVYVADLRFVADTLTQIDQGSFATTLTGHLDLSRLGLYGHSLGGGAVIGFCQTDTRCSAGLGFDPWVEPLPNTTIEKGLTVPFAFVRSEEWVDNENDTRLRRLYDAGSADEYWHTIDGTLHRDFVFVPLVSPVGGLLGISGDTNPGRVVDILDEELTAFFGKYLRGEDPAFLLNPASAFEEISAESR